MDSKALASMYAQVVNGGDKETSRFVTDDESSRLWDQIVAEVAAIRRVNPNAHFSIPNEVPDPDDTPDQEPDQAPDEPPDTGDTGPEPDVEPDQEPEPEPTPA